MNGMQERVFRGTQARATRAKSTSTISDAMGNIAEYKRSNDEIEIPEQTGLRFCTFLFQLRQLGQLEAHIVTRLWSKCTCGPPVRPRFSFVKAKRSFGASNTMMFADPMFAGSTHLALKMQSRSLQKLDSRNVWDLRPFMSVDPEHMVFAENDKHREELNLQQLQCNVFCLPCVLQACRSPLK